MAASSSSKIVRTLRLAHSLFGKQIESGHYHTYDPNELGVLKDAIASIQAVDVAFDSKLVESNKTIFADEDATTTTAKNIDRIDDVCCSSSSTINSSSTTTTDSTTASGGSSCTYQQQHCTNSTATTGQSSDYGGEQSLSVYYTAGVATHNQNKKSIKEKAPVVFVRIYDDRKVMSASIFALRAGARLPLHNHPGMHGIIKCIHGTLKVQSYTKLDENHSPQQSDDLSIGETTNHHHINMRAKIHPPLTVSSSDQCALLLEPTERNIHSIHAIDGPAAFVDFLSPPYQGNDRPCHYYEVVANGPQDNVCSLREIQAPSWYWCDEAHYKGPTE